MGSEGSKPVPFNKMTSAELQRVRRRSLSDNNLTVSRVPDNKPKFRRTMSLKKSLKKRKNRSTLIRPVTSVDISANDIQDVRAQGYLHKCQKGADWESVWCILSGGTLYIFSSPLDDEALDTIQLDRCSFRQFLEGYGDRLHVVEVHQEPYYPEFIAMETAEDMASWLKHLKTTVFEVSIEQSLIDPSNDENPSIGKITDVDSAILPSSEWESCDNNNTNKTMYIRSQSDNCFLDNDEPTSPDSVQRELILLKKQQLLQEVLLQKQQLQEQKDPEATSKYDQPHSPTDTSPLTPNIPDDPTLTPWQPSPDDEKQLKELLLLKQRKMSTELKVETLQRMLQPVKPHKKKIRLPTLRKAKSQDNLLSDSASQSHTLEELEHWSKQLMDLQDELGFLTGEIQEREQRSTWYSGAAYGQDQNADTEKRSVSLLSEKGLLKNYLRKPSSSSTKSDGCFDDDNRNAKSDKSTKVEPRARLCAQNSNNIGSDGESKNKLQSRISNSSIATTASTLSFLPDSKNGSPNISSREPLYTPSCKRSRTQKITSLGKKFPALQSLRRGRMQKSRSQDDDDPSIPILPQDRRSSFDICRPNPPEVDRPSTKRVSVDDRLVTGRGSPLIQRMYNATKFLNVNEVKELPNVPPNSRRSSQEDLTDEDEHSANVICPGSPDINKSESLLSVVMQAFDTMSKSSSKQSLGSPNSSENAHVTFYGCDDVNPGSKLAAQSRNIKDALDRLNSTDSHKTLSVTNSLEIASGAQTPELTIYNGELNNIKPKKQISKQALENIAAFEQLIRDKMGIWM